MKIVTPPSYTKIFSITAHATNVVAPHRGLLLVCSGGVGSITVTNQDGSSQQIQNIANNTVFILPLTVRSVTAVTNVAVYGLL